ncbi:uncharacterized protein LOC142558316 [Dermacentor variabilis]|uniref:uncharacterized protein LOC142558316 n=1 Tax=Dermacentor variabilis TaxID=34621 RepID=UPI003F5B21DB
MTTAYHPMSNGMVERFHRQLKAAVMASEHDSWGKALPMVLLGIRTAYKADVSCSAAELVYGTTLRLPGDFFASGQQQARISASDYTSRLRGIMNKLRATPPRQPTERRTDVRNELESCSHVFLRNGAVRRPLQAPYDGPFKVLRRGGGGGGGGKLSRWTDLPAYMDKPAYMGTQSMPPTFNPSSGTHTEVLRPRAAVSTRAENAATPDTRTYHTRSGRRLNAPNRLNL